MVRPVGETRHLETQLGPALPAVFHRGPSRGIASLPWASRLAVDRDWLGYSQRSLLGDGLALVRAFGRAHPVISRAQAPSPLPERGVLIRAP